jgi:hypothetical protein
MYTQHNVPGPEYRVRPVVRYVVTRYCFPYVHDELDGNAHSVPGGSTVIGEFPSEQTAYDVAGAMGNLEPDWRNSLELAPPPPGGYVPGPQHADD